VLGLLQVLGQGMAGCGLEQVRALRWLRCWATHRAPWQRAPPLQEAPRGRNLPQLQWRGLLTVVGLLVAMRRKS